LNLSSLWSPLLLLTGVLARRLPTDDNALRDNLAWVSNQPIPAGYESGADVRARFSATVDEQGRLVPHEPRWDGRPRREVIDPAWFALLPRVESAHAQAEHDDAGPNSDFIPTSAPGDPLTEWEKVCLFANVDFEDLRPYEVHRCSHFKPVNFTRAPVSAGNPGPANPAIDLDNVVVDEETGEYFVEIGNSTYPLAVDERGQIRLYSRQNGVGPVVERALELQRLDAFRTNQSGGFDDGLSLSAPILHEKAGKLYIPDGRQSFFRILIDQLNPCMVVMPEGEDEQELRKTGIPVYATRRFTIDLLSARGRRSKRAADSAGALGDWGPPPGPSGVRSDEGGARPPGDAAVYYIDEPRQAAVAAPAPTIGRLADGRTHKPIEVRDLLGKSYAVYADGFHDIRRLYPELGVALGSSLHKLDFELQWIRATFDPRSLFDYFGAADVPEEQAQRIARGFEACLRKLALALQRIKSNSSRHVSLAEPVDATDRYEGVALTLGERIYIPPAFARLDEFQRTQTLLHEILHFCDPQAGFPGPCRRDSVPPFWVGLAAARQAVRAIVECDFGQAGDVFKDPQFVDELNYHFVSVSACHSEGLFCKSKGEALAFLLKDAEVVSYFLRWLFESGASARAH
jgi:hypothetical protein